MIVHYQFGFFRIAYGKISFFSAVAAVHKGFGTVCFYSVGGNVFAERDRGSSVWRIAQTPARGIVVGTLNGVLYVRAPSYVFDDRRLSCTIFSASACSF